MLKFILAGAAALFATSLLVASPAKADVIYFYADFCSGGCGTPPFGSVTLTQSGTSVDVDVNVASFGNTFVTTGQGVLDTNVLEFNVTGGSLSDITVDAHAPALEAVTGSFGSSNVGDFAFGIKCPTCGNGLAGGFTTDIDFSVANATIADLRSVNSQGFNFATDIYSGSTKNTGAVAAPAPPIGRGLPAVLAIGGILFGAKLWERRKKASFA